MIAGTTFKYYNNTATDEVVAFIDLKMPVASVFKKINSREIAYKEVYNDVIVFTAELID